MQPILLQFGFMYCTLLLDIIENKTLHSLYLAGGKNQGKVWRFASKETSINIQCKNIFSTLSNLVHLNLHGLITSTVKIVACFQDKEHAFFDSADWALGKVT